jgi:hypothetical protein
MSFTRVVEDGVEFYTLKSNGASGMSIIGLARICRVDDKSIAYHLDQIARNKVRSKRLKHLVGKDLYLGISPETGAKIIRAEVCAAIIAYYAFESQKKTEEALYAFEKFAAMGIEAWIQSITGWKPSLPAPEPTFDSVEKFINDRLAKGLLAVAVHPEAVIELLQESGFSSAGLRLYFYLEMRALQSQTPDIDTICQDLKISRSTFKKWLPEVQDWSHCADWVKLPTRQGPERQIQLRLHKELGGKMEAHTPIGPVDLVTKTEIIEIKRVEDWKTAFGQVIAKSQSFPKHTKRIHLFGESSKQLKKITAHCQTFDVVVTFEKVVLESELAAA